MKYLGFDDNDNYHDSSLCYTSKAIDIHVVPSSSSAWRP